MTLSNRLPVAASIVLMLSVAGPSYAQSQNRPWVQMQTTSVNLGIGGQQGEGMLYLPNLGTNCAYPFKVSGFGAGLHVGVSTATATGVVQHLTRIADFNGSYTSIQGEATVLAGGGGMQMKNTHNNVILDLRSTTRGIGLGIGSQGVTIQLSLPVIEAPRTYEVSFGFNKTWVNRTSRAILDQLSAAWKCRDGYIWLFGYTDTVGKEDQNLALSAKRAAAVREYLIGTGIVPRRIKIKPMGEKHLRVPTPQNYRLRSNRAVVAVIQE